MTDLPLSRRTFLKLTGAAGTWIGSGLLPVFAGTGRQPSSPAATAWSAFRNPSAEARPFFRCWWNGNQVEHGQLLRELRAMAEAGAGGIEINPIAMPEDAVAVPGKELVWLSPEWNRLLLEIATQARHYGMISDLIVGTGWPFGGEFLEEDETVQGLELFTIDLEGSETHVRLPRQPGEHERIEQVLLLPLQAKDPNQAREVTTAVSASGDLSVELDGRPHRLFLVLWRNRFREVMYGAKGGAGPVLDHFNREAVVHYLNHM